MKVIDEKGKLFGLINIIDLSVILLIGLLIFGGSKRLKKKPILAVETSEATITYEVSDVRMATVSKVKVGDPIFHYDKGEYIGEIVDVSYEAYKEPVEFEDRWVDAEVPGKYTVTFKVKADVRDSKDFILAGGEQTRTGSQQRLKNKFIAFFATVLDLELD